MTTIIAHRGASFLAPENTMPAFELAHQMKAEGIETDIQLTSDNIPVIIHDENIKRTTNSSGLVKDLTYNQLKGLDAGSWFSAKYAGASVLRLSDFLAWASDKPLQLNLELKNNKIDYKNLERIVFDMVEEYKVADRTVFSTFNHSSVERLKKYNDKVGVALLTSKKRKNLASYAKELGANAIHIKYKLLDKTLVQDCKEENLALRVYTVNKIGQIMHCFKMGADGIFTDVPDKALSYRRLYSLKK